MDATTFSHHNSMANPLVQVQVNRSKDLKDKQNSHELNPAEKNSKPNVNDEEKKLAEQDYPFSKKMITKELEKANHQLNVINRGLKFNFHEETDRMYVSVINKENDEVIKEIPPSELLDLLAKVWEHSGILMDKRV